MIPLAGSLFPASHGELSEAILRGLAQHQISAREVVAEGGIFPAVEKLRVDLTGARISRELQITSTGSPGNERVQVGVVSVIGHPIFFEDAPLQLELHAEGATLGAARAVNGAPMLMLNEAKRGLVTLETKRRDLEAAVHNVISSLAARQGVEIKSTALHLESRGPRSLGFRAEVTAKMFVMSAKVTVSGDLEVDHELGAHLAHLACTGEGMVGTAATAVVRPYLEKLESRVFPLVAFSLGNVRLNDVELETGESIHLRAAFAS